MHQDVAVLTDVLDTNLSRTIELVGSEEVQILQSNIQDNWRLVLTAGKDSDVQAKIVVRNLASIYTVKSTCPRGGAIDFTGYGSVTVEVKNLTVNNVIVEASLTTQTSETPSYQFCTSTQPITNAGFVDVQSDVVDGFSPPFTRYVRIFTDGNIDLQFVDGGGVVVGSYLGLTPEAVLLNELHVPPLAKLQAKSVAANGNIMALWF